MKQQESFLQLSNISFSDIHFFKDGDLIFSTIASTDTIGYTKANILQCDSALLDMLISFSDKNACVYAEDMLIHYGILRFDDGVCCITGPFSVKKMNQQQLVLYARAHHIPLPSGYQIRSFSYYQNQDLLRLIYKIYTANDDGLEIVLPPEPYFPPVSPKTDARKTYSLQTYRFQNSENGIVHHPYYHENFLRSCIKSGDLASIQKLFFDPAASVYSTGIMSKNSRKQEEYTVVSAMHLFCSAAIEGGVSPYAAYDISDMYLQKLSSSTEVDEYQRIFFDALQSYIKAVSDAQEAASLSIHVKKCKQYIIQHLNKPISLNQLASYVELTPAYLSTLFHETEGVTLKSYIQSERIHAAENLLKYSDYPIAHISSYLCFQSQSYFGAVFKEHTGMTPGQYRKLNKPQGF